MERLTWGHPEFEGGDFGLFTDLTPTDNSLTPGLDAQIYVWEGTLTGGDIEPYEGDNGISWNTTGMGWFGAGIMSMQPINLFNFAEGHLNFRIKIPANISFQIGIIDSWGNQSYVDFPSNQTTYGLTRDGDWGQASIPVQDIRGQFIDLRMLSYEFVILEVNGASCQFALDDIYWSGGGQILSIPNTFPDRYLLMKNFPNPFNPITNIEYNVPENAMVNVTIYDMVGRKVKSLFNGYQDKGYKSITWNATNDRNESVPSGVYLYKIESGKLQQTKKMLLVK